LGCNQTNVHCVMKKKVEKGQGPEKSEGKSEPFYNVVYSKMGNTIKESFPTLEKAIEDYEEKARLDKLGYFDDRFVIGVEDHKGVTIDIADYKLKSLKSLAVLTARGGSKRIHKKNIKAFCGKPIIAYSIEAALGSGLFQEVIVSTDCKEIAGISREYGANVPFFRSDKTANDHAGLSEVIEEVKAGYRNSKAYFDTLCCILPTAPFISTHSLKKGAQLLIEKNADVTLPIVRFSSPVQRAYKSRDGKLDMFYPQFYKSRSQDLEPAYHDSGMFYWMKFDKQLESANKFGFEIPQLQAQDIDTMEDWELAELKYCLMQSKNGTASA